MMNPFPTVSDSITTILWDMDGVLVNSEEIWEREYPSFLKASFGIDFNQAYYPKLLGKTISAIYQCLCQYYPSLKSYGVEPYIEAEKAYGLSTIYPQTTLYGVTSELLQYFRSRGFQMALVSSSPPEWIAACLERHGLEDCFVFTLSAVTEGVEKPAPDLYLRAAKRLGVDPSECLVIEDSESGIEAGRRAGMEVWRFEGGSNSASALSPTTNY